MTGLDTTGENLEVAGARDRTRSVTYQLGHAFYRAAKSAIEIVRVLHERMDPASHVATTKPPTKRRRGT